MAKSKTLHESESRQERAAVAAFLRELADQFDAGTITLGEGKKAHSTALPAQLELEVKLERKKKDKKKRRKYGLEIELEWREPEPEPEPEEEEEEEVVAGLLAPLDEPLMLENPERVLLEAPEEEE